MNMKKLLTIVGVLAILVAALPAGAAFAQGPSGQNPPLVVGRFRRRACWARSKPTYTSARCS